MQYVPIQALDATAHQIEALVSFTSERPLLAKSWSDLSAGSGREADFGCGCEETAWLAFRSDIRSCEQKPSVQRNANPSRTGVAGVAARAETAYIACELDDPAIEQRTVDAKA